LLDVLYRAGAYPFDDFTMDDGAGASIWVIPRTLNWPVVLAIRGNGVSTVALIRELHRMSQAFQAHHGAEATTTMSTGERMEWTYQIEFHCEGTFSRVLGRTIIPREPEELSGMMNCWIFVPWFQPWDDPRYTASYPPGGKVFDGAELPPLGAEDTDTDTHYEWDNLPAPDTGAEFELPLPPEAAEAFSVPFEGTFSSDEFDDDDDGIPDLPPPPEATLAALDGALESDGPDAPEGEYRLERSGRRWVILDPDGDPIDEETYLKRDAIQIVEDLNSTEGSFASLGRNDDPEADEEDAEDEEDEDGDEV